MAALLEQSPGGGERGTYNHVPDALAQLVQDPGGLKHGGAWFNKIFIAGHIFSVLSDKLSYKQLLGEHMTNLWGSAQLIEHALLWTSRSAS